MKRTLLVVLAGLAAFTTRGQWVLDGEWNEDGRVLDPSDRWEVPVSIAPVASEIVLLNAAYDGAGEVIPRWRGFSVQGVPTWEGEGEVGERPIDATHGTWEDRWFMLSEVPATIGDTLGSLLRVRAFLGSAPIDGWGQDGLVDLAFVGPLHEGGGIHARDAGSEGPEDLWNWVVVSGAAFDSCCAHQELPALSVLNAWDGSYHPDFGQEGRIVLDPDGWQVEDSVRHAFSGRFTKALFVPWDPMGSDPSDIENIRILAGGTYALAGAFRPFLAMFRWDGSLETEFGDAGIMSWFEDANLNHGIRDLRHRWEWLGPEEGVQVLIGSPEGESTLAAGTMSIGYVPLWPESTPVPVTADIDPGIPVNAPARSVALASGFGLKLEDETVAVGTLHLEAGWNGQAHPVWWTGPNGAFGGVGAYWTEDTEFPSQRVGAAASRGSRLYIAGTLPGDAPTSSTVVLSRWTEDTSGLPGQTADRQVPHPFPTRDDIQWECPPGAIQCLDGQGRLLGQWTHAGGRFRAELPRGGVWLGSVALGWHRVLRLD